MIPCGKPILVLAVIAVITGALVATRPATRRSDGLVVWTFADTHASSYRALAPQFERDTHRSVDVKLVTVSAISLRLAAAFDRDLPSDPALPDVVEIEIGTVGSFFRPSLENVGFLPLNNLLSTSKFRDRFISSRLAPWTKEGIIFGVPHDVHPVSLTYRQDLFDEAGIDLSRASTWRELQDDCLAFQRFWSARGFPNRRAIELPSSASDVLLMMLQQRGINPLDDRNVVHLADARVAETVAFYARLVAGSNQVAADASPGVNVWIDDFARGDSCALLTADWRAGMLRDAMRDTLAGKVAMMPIPRFDPTDAPTASWGGTMAAIPRRCRDPQAAFDLITYLYSSPSGVATRWRDTMILPADQTLWSDPAFHQPDAFFSQQRCGELYIDLAKHLPPRYVTPYTALASAELASILTRAVVSVRNGAVDDAALVSQIQIWLDDAARELRKRIEFGNFNESNAKAQAAVDL